MIHEIEGYARGYGLDFFPVIFEMIDYEEINMVAALRRLSHPLSALALRHAVRVHAEELRLRAP